MDMSCSGCFEDEIQTVTSGRQTPITQQRRPLQRINFNTVLSPTKRRKQNHAESPSSVVDLKLGREETLTNASPDRGAWTERQHNGNALLEVFSRLDVRNLVDNAAPVCRLWREVAQSKELWAVLRQHLRLVDQLIITDKVVERRSKGRLFRCRRLGTGDAVLLRVIDLELTNAGKDDGAPTSFLREAALLSKIKHPNVIRHFGSEICGKRAVMCTEFVHETFSLWIKRLDERPSERLLDIKIKFQQVLEGLSFVHRRGIMHRNLKPDNIFLDAHETVKLGDFTQTRMLDVPLQAYTPEDPKERDRSGREMRRLWYRAPELILREEIYGPKVDSWSVGCLLAEAATGRALIQSDSEIDHLFRVFRMRGTPTPKTWPEVVSMKNFSPKFPLYSGFSFAQVSRAVCNGAAGDQDALIAQAQSDRKDVLQCLFRTAAVLGRDGMFVLDQLLALQSTSRACADSALETPFFSQEREVMISSCLVRAGGEPDHPSVSAWLSNKQEQQGVGPQFKSPCGDSCPPLTIPPSSAPSQQIVWSILNVMREREPTGGLMSGLHISTEKQENRTVMMDFIIGLASTLTLSDYTVHLAAGIIDKVLALQGLPLAADKRQVLGATCLKIADVFAEQSKEYYKQENVVEYAEATHHQLTAEQMLTCEKELLPKLSFDLYMPTAHWFVQCYLAYGKFTPGGKVGRIACFISDLTLLDYDLLAYPASLRAQCAFLLGVFLVQAEHKQPLQQPPLAASSGNRIGAGCEEQQLTYLDHWDQHVRERACQGNSAINAAMCLQEVVRALVVLRREWRNEKLTAVETKHANLARTVVYPVKFPVSKLVRYILPDRQVMEGHTRSTAASQQQAPTASLRSNLTEQLHEQEESVAVAADSRGAAAGVGSDTRLRKPKVMWNKRNSTGVRST